MVKVLHIVDTYLNHSESWLYDLIKNVKECEVHIGCKIRNDNFSTPEDWKVITYRYSELLLNDVTHAFKSRPFYKLAIKAKLKLVPTFRSFLNRYIKENEIDVLHAHFGNIGYEMLKLSIDSGVPLITSFYGFDYDMISNTDKKWSKKLAKLFEKCASIVVEGEHGKSRLIKKGCPKNKIHVINLGLENVEFKRLVDKKNSEFKILQIASFTEKKGQIYTIKAFEEAAYYDHKLHLTLIGDHRDKSYSKSIIDLIEKSKFRDRISMRNFVDRADLDHILQTHDLFIHPSLHTIKGDSEGGAPTILFYAMRNKVPILSTLHCDIPNVIPHKVCGFLVEERNIHELSSAILKIAKSSNKELNRMTNNALERLRTHYNLNLNAIKLMSIYKSYEDSHL